MTKIIPGRTVEPRESDAKVFALSKGEVEAMRETLGKCINPQTGLPVSARAEVSAVFPASGSVKRSEDGNGTGQCPHCGAHVKLSGKGWVTAHNVRRNPVPTPSPTVRLQERQAEVTDTGARVGSPDAAMRTRDAELRAAAGTATVRIRVKGPDGKTAETEVPATEDNVRTAIRQEQRKKVPDAAKLAKLGPAAAKLRGPDAAKLAKLGSMLRALTGTQAVGVIGAQPGTFKVREAVVLDAPNAPEGRDERAREGDNGHVPTSPGPALVQGAAMAAKEPRRTTSKGGPRNAAGWSAPLGRPRPDRGAIVGDPEACKGKGCTVVGCVAIIGGRDGYMTCAVFRTLSKTQTRRYWAHVASARSRREAASNRARELRERANSRDIPVMIGRITDHRK